MDFIVHNIKAFARLFSAPNKHTAHKTMRVPCLQHGRALRWICSPPSSCPTLGGLLNVYLVAVGSTNFRKIDRRFLFIFHLFYGSIAFGNATCWLTWLSAWQCYIAKYP